LNVVRARFHDARTTAEHVSRRGGYLSLTITVRALNREQLDAVYHELVKSDEVLMVL
jgi:putative lipoic acid-binding regulatory protein